MCSFCCKGRAGWSAYDIKKPRELFEFIFSESLSRYFDACNGTCGVPRENTGCHWPFKVSLNWGKTFYGHILQCTLLFFYCLVELNKSVLARSSMTFRTPLIKVVLLRLLNDPPCILWPSGINFCIWMMIFHILKRDLKMFVMCLWGNNRQAVIAGALFRKVVGSAFSHFFCKRK